MADWVCNWKLIGLASTELAKGCILFATGKANLHRQDLVSCCVNSYYSTFHFSVGILALSPSGVFLEKGVVEWKERSSPPRRYLPCSHNDLIKLTETISPKLAATLKETRQLREFLYYGPYFCVDSTPEFKPIIYTCEFENIDQKLESFYFTFPFEDVSQATHCSLKDKTRVFILTNWVKDALEILKDSFNIDELTYAASKEVWANLREPILEWVRGDKKE